MKKNKIKAKMIKWKFYSIIIKHSKIKAKKTCG